MNRFSSFFVLASVALVSGCLAGCSGEIAEPGADRGPASKLDVPGDVAAQPGPSVKGDQATGLGPSFEVGGVVSPEVFVCRKGAFCDDFENAAAPSRWTDSVVNGGTIGRGTSSASLGAGSLALASKPGADNSAFLVFEKGYVAATWKGALSFAMRAPSVPSESLGGPELVVKTPADGVVSLAIVLKPEGLFLEQRATAECGKGRCQTKSKFLGATVAGAWDRIDIGIEAAPSGGAPYGRVEVRVNGGALVTTDLSVPLGDGTAFLNAGITSGDVREAFLDLDDVSLFTR